MLHMCLLSYQKPTSSTGTKAACWGEHIYLHDGCLAHRLRPQLYSWRWFSRFGRMVVKIDCKSWASCQKLPPASAAPGDSCPPSLSSELAPPSIAICLCLAFGVPVASSALAVLSSPLSLRRLWSPSLWDSFGLPLNLKNEAAKPAHSLGVAGSGLSEGKTFDAFFSFGAKENRLIKTNGLGEVLAAASHIGFIDWILFSLGFQIFLSYYFSCHILNCFLSYTHCLCLPFGKTFLQSYTSSVQ